MTDCGITNLGSCLAEKLVEYLIYILNLPITPLLDFIKILMTEPVNISIFSSVWAIIVYILSMFYGLLLLVAGFRFMLSGYSVDQREKAKRELRNVIIMMILVQSSFFIYSLILDLSAGLTASVFNLISPDFFLLTADSIGNVGLELLLLMPYVFVLVSTLIFLTIRYICVSLGVILFSIGIFFYFIGSLNSYGKLILNYLGVLIAVPFFYSIIFLASAKFLEVDTFANMKISAMISAFGLADLLTLFLILFVIIKAANAVEKPVREIATIAAAFA